MIANFCHHEFWDLNQTWNAEVPDFSSCFQDTMLVFLPCVIFSTVAIINLCLLPRYVPENSLPWTWRIILKVILGVLLFIISVIWCVLYIYKQVTDGNVPVSVIIASFARAFTYVIVVILMLKHRSHGVTTSSVLSSFWICFAFTGIIMHRSVILNYSNQVNSPDLNYILHMVYYPLIYFQLIMSFFVDVKSFSRLEYGSPLEEENLLSNITYMWFNRIVYRGLKRLLTVEDFLPLAVKLKSSYTYEVFSKYWKFHLSEADFKKQSLALALLKSFWPWLLGGFILDIIFVMTLVVPPIILDGILEFVKDDYYWWRSYFYCAAIFLASFVGKTILNNCVMYLLCLSAQVKSCLIAAVYRKNLIIASAARKNFTSGSITNLISVDVYRISQFALYATGLISAPFRIILIISVLWQYLGPSCLAGVAFIVLLIPVSFYASRISERYTDRQMVIKDIRLKCMNEVIQGIKILKFYAWEVPFSSKISKTRKDEIKVIRLSQMCYIITTFVFSCTPILVSIASFTTFLLVDSKHVLDPVRAFVSITLLEQLRFALFEIPDGLSELIQTMASMGRIRTFFMSEETVPCLVGSDPDEEKAVTFKQATLQWSKEEDSFTLENIDFSVPVGSLIAIIGPVGCGKTSLLSSMLGDMYKLSGSVDVKGELAYVPQEAWILNRSLKNNILLEKPMHESIYHRIVDRCCLKPDLKILPGGDGTEIGEKGINLSGGQKQRISLARAVFQNKDIYLLDDPLSAVDAHVRKALFEDVIGSRGLLKNKTRILVTHDISILPHVDLIIRMEDGKILESGTYKELMNSGGTFLNFISTHLGKTEKDDFQSGDKTPEAAGDSNINNIYTRTISEDFVKPTDTKFSDTALIEEEKMEEGGVKRGIYLKYMKQVGWPILSMAVLGYVAFVAFESAGNIWLAHWSADPVKNGTQDTSRTIWRLSVYAGLGAAEAFFIVFGVAWMVYGSTKASELYHKQMLQSILKSPMSFFDTTPMGRIINRFSTDMDTLDIHIIYNIDGWINCILYALATFIIIGMNTPLFLACIIPLMALYYMFLKLHLNTSRQIMRLQSTTRSPIYSHLLESIFGVSSIKAFKVENQFIDKLEENVDKHIACAFNTASCNRWLHFWLDLIGCTVVLIATLLCLTNRDTLGASAVGLVITYALTVTDALMWLVRSNTELENKSVAVERVDEYCHLQSEADWQKPDDPEISWPENGEIVFDNYSTRYRENLDLVLKDLNLNIHSNEKVGIIGRTGAGKSSVTLALFRIIEPAQGTILIDNVDLSKIGLHALRSKLTIIPQDPVLFTGSLRFNLDPNDEYDDDDIWKSLENSHLKEFVSGLSEGLQHNIEEGGGNLSAGQKQLLCLSRALLKKSKILVLDEATAAVDMDTDSLVQDTIKTAFAEHTVITIAHRLNTIMDYDKIVVMSAGEVVEVGKPAELLQNKNSHFFGMSREAGLV